MNLKKPDIVEPTSSLMDLKTRLATVLSLNVESIKSNNDEICLTRNTCDLIRDLSTLRDDARCQFKQLTDLFAVDYPDRAFRFEVVYQLLSLKFNCRVRVKIMVKDGDAVPSINRVFSCANWYEREVWDMYGIHFSDHPDLRRLLTDYGFYGHPLRKDFPLTGFVEVRYNDEQGRVAYQNVELSQEFRTFDFMSPWDGAPQILGGSNRNLDESSGDEDES